MSLFPATIVQALGGGRVDYAMLVKFDFASGPMRVWSGNFTLRTLDGQTWQNIGSLGDVTGIEQAINGDAPMATFTLSGVDMDVVRKARDEYRTEVKGRLAIVYVQFFGTDDADDPDNQQLLDNPFPIASFTMRRPSFSLARGQNGEADQASVSITGESIFALRSRPRSALYTDRDQQARFPGDKGFQYVGSLVSKVVTWPDF